MTGIPHQASQQAIPDAISEAQKNTAWVSIEVPVPPDRVFNFLQNTERLFRLNPYLDIREWKEISGGFPFNTPLRGKRFHLKALNEMNGVAYDLLITIESIQPGARFFLNYQGYDKVVLKRALEITLQPGVRGLGGSILTLREHYHAPPTEGEYQEQQLKEVDQSLFPWASSIRQYLLRLERWGWFWPYRWYRERFWLSMRPTHRRIARLLVWVTVLEFIVFLFVFTIYWLELARA